MIISETNWAPLVKEVLKKNLEDLLVVVKHEEKQKV